MNVSSVGNGANLVFTSFAQLKEYIESDAIPRLPRTEFKTLLPPSEKGNYTKEDALLNQYMKQFDPEVNGRIILTEMITDTELDAFRQKLATNGLCNEIDWRGIKNDFVHMHVGFDNAEKLNTKIDYIASRYAVLKDRIETNYSGDEKTAQIDILNRLLEDVKKTIADTYSKSIGGFYDEFGDAGTSEKMRDSLLAGIDNRIEEYSSYLSKAGDYSGITDDSEKWLLQDDGYMAARLRESMASENGVVGKTSAQSDSKPEYTLHDLGIAAIVAKESNKQLTSDLYGAANEQSIGLDLAIQAMKIDYLTKDANISSKMAALINNSFNSYIKTYLNMLEQGNKTQAEKLAATGISSGKTNIDRDAVYAVYNYTMKQYRTSGNIMDAFTKGAEKARDMFSGNKGDWDNFFKIPQYGNNISDISTYEKYEKTINQFLDSLKYNDEKNIALFFGLGGKTSAERYNDTMLNVYA